MWLVMRTFAVAVVMNWSVFVLQSSKVTSPQASSDGLLGAGGADALGESAEMIGGVVRAVVVLPTFDEAYAKPSLKK